MRVSFSFPTATTLNTFLHQKRTTDLNYDEVEATRGLFPNGYDHDRNRIWLGEGNVVWEKAKEAIREWKQFPSGWTKIHPVDTPIEKDETVAMLFRLFGLWWKNSTRIIYLIDEPKKFGFAYGTVKGHVERGEEIFCVEKDAEGKVYYKVEAFSRPDFWLTKLGYLLARFYQKKFARESMAQMKKICSHDAVLQKN